MTRRTGIAIVIAAIAIRALIGSTTGVASGLPSKPVRAQAPIEGEDMVGYGSSRLLLFQHYFPTTTPAITLLGADGKIDRSFGTEGTVARYANDIAVDPRGRILLASDGYGEGPNESGEPLLARLLPSGRLDPSFGADGVAAIGRGQTFGEASAVAVEADGDILLGGGDLASHHGRECLQVIRLKTDGSRDHSFGNGGVATLYCNLYEEQVLSLAPTPSGGVIVAVGNNGEIGVMKLRADGSQDRHFGHGGFYEMPFHRQVHGRTEDLLPVSGAVVTPSGKILLAASGYALGGPERVVAVRLLPDGRVDLTYGNDGWATADKVRGDAEADGSTLLPDGVLAVATDFRSGEHSQFGAVAFGPDGRPERGFDGHGRCRSRLPGSHEVLNVAALRGRAVVVSDPYATEHWLLHC